MGVGESLFEAFEANYHGVNPPNMVNVKPPT